MMLKKGLLSGLLAVTTAMTTIAVNVMPSYAAGPYQLNQRGNDTDFPTWHAGKSTKLCVKNLDGGKSALVTVNVKAGGNHGEEVKVSRGKTKCINRYWAGAYINVVNSGETSVEVWTE